MPEGLETFLLRKLKHRRDKSQFGIHIQRCGKKSIIPLHQAVERNIIEIEMNKSDLIEKYIRGEATAEEREQVNEPSDAGGY